MTFIQWHPGTVVRCIALVACISSVVTGSSCTNFAELEQTAGPGAAGTGGSGGGPAFLPAAGATNGAPPPAPQDVIPVAEGSSAGAASTATDSAPVGNVADAGAAEGGSLGLDDAGNVPRLCEGFGVELDGSAHVSIPRSVQDDFTLEAWLKTTTSLNGNSAFYGRAIFDADVVGLGDDFAVSVLNGGLAFAVGNPDTTLQGSTPIATGEWVHVAVTREASSGRLQVFVDGVLDASAATPNRNSLVGAPAISVGGLSGVRNFVGTIDEIRIWSVVRSADELAASLHTRLMGTEVGLVGYFDFEERGGELALDRSPTKEPARRVGAPASVVSTALCARPAPR